MCSDTFFLCLLDAIFVILQFWVKFVLVFFLIEWDRLFIICVKIFVITVCGKENLGSN